MPLEERYVRHAHVDTLFAYLPQLAALDLGYFERNYVLQALANPERFRNQGEYVRDLVMAHRQRLERIIIPGNVQSFADSLNAISPLEYRRLTEGRWDWSAVDPQEGINGEIVAPGSLHIPPENIQVEIRRIGEPTPMRRKKKSWELAFMDEADETDFFKSPLLDVNQWRPEDEREPVLVAGTMKSLKEIAAMLPPGVLGMQFDAKGSPYNLMFRPERQDDPRKKLLKGRGWFEVKGSSGVWWAAATLEAYNILYDTGLEFKITPKAKRWYEYVTSNEMLPGMRFPEDCPLFDYQRDGVQFLVRRRRAMLSLSPGLGKTLTSSYAASMLEYVGLILLVCPASLLHYWHSELTKWSPSLPLKPMPEIWHRETGTKPEHAELNNLSNGKPCQFWAITNPETVTRFTDEFLEGGKPPWDLMIVDESIMYKHRETKRSEAIKKLAAAIPEVWLLTGAPATRYLDDMWHQFHILNDRGYGSYWRFAEQYCVVDENVWAKTVVANKRDAEEEIKDNFKDIYFARSQEQVADIPDWLMEDLDVPMKPKQEALYQKLQEELRIEIGDRDSSEIITVDNRFSLILRSLQIASNPVLLGADNTSGKWTALPELMEIYPGPFLVWVNFIRTGEMLQESLRQKFGENKVFMANGSTPMEERQVLVDNFQAGKMDALILNSTVGKFGFTLTKARTSFFMERGYDDSYFQCLYRNRRIGTTFSPVVVNMRSVTRSGNRTIDHVIHDALDYRNSMIKKITIGDLRGILDE